MEHKKESMPAKELPLLPLRGVVVFPGMMLHFDVGRKKSLLALNEAMNEEQLIYLTSQRDVRVDDPALEDLHPVGVVAQVRQVLRMSEHGVRVLVEGLYRARAIGVAQEEPFMTVQIRQCAELKRRDATYATALIREAKQTFDEYAEISSQVPPDVVLGVMAADEAGYLADYIASNILPDAEDKQIILNDLRPFSRLEKVINMLKDECNVMSIGKEISSRVHEQIDKNQREYFLREQMKAITTELGDAENPQEEADTYKTRIEKLALPAETEEKLLREAGRLAKMPPGSHEGAVIRTYLDTCLDLPWNKQTKDHIDVAKAKKVLDRDHYGMEKIKERILELLAVRQLAPDVKGQIICFAGPPGVGKTSIARSIAAAMGRKYARLSLGGVRDEADIRGHRKTYIGAMPGRLINAVRQAGSRNPLILLDEVDKLANDFRGDPTSALLEVLDPEQNAAFCDHYIEVPFDLSNVLFITTANDTDRIPAPLYDRMEVIQLSSYTIEEKRHIAERHLIPKQRARHGLSARTFKLRSDTVNLIIDGYTREAGVRNLERVIASLCRKAAKRIVAGESKSVTVLPSMLEEMLGPRRFKPDEDCLRDEVGVATGLAWTALGGETMPIEIAVVEGSGKIELTGRLGDVMKESARAAITYIRAHANELRVPQDFYKTRDIHIHVPENAIPKDGPSAGITIATALTSALTGRQVRGDVAMTGEVTLRGRVLPIGGLKEKAMAAFRAGVKTVIIPAANAPDLADVSDLVKEHVRFVPAERLDAVLDLALLEPTAPLDEMPERQEPMPLDLAVSAPMQRPEMLAQKGWGGPC